MARMIKDSNIDWSPVRPELTQGVEGKLLLDGATKIVLTRIASGGKFRVHRDPYGHLFHILTGRARVQVGGAFYDLDPGEGVRIAPGELHGYENRGDKEMLLISVNLPTDG